MMRVFILVVVLFLVGCSKWSYSTHTEIGQTQYIEKKTKKIEGILKLDTLGHRGRINDIITTYDGEIISASDDKTVRVWDSDGVEKRKILGQIGLENEGIIYAIALSSDKKYLAVGGHFGKFTDTKTGAIRIYHYKTGKLIKVLKSHTSIVNDLSFSFDNRYLISGSSDKSAKIWNVQNNFQLKDTINIHTSDVYAVKIINKNKKYFAITAGFDNKISLYDMQTKQVLNSHKLNYKLQFLAIAKKLKHIAVCGYYTKKIKIYDYDLNLIKTISSETKPNGLNYSRDNQYLISGSGAYPFNVNIYNSKDYSKKTYLRKHKDLTNTVNFINKNNKIYAVSGGGINNEIYIWDIRTGKVDNKIVGDGNRIASVGINEDKIAWGNEITAINGKSKLQKSINLKNFSIKNIYQSKVFKRISITNGEYSLTHSKGGDYEKSNAILNIIRNGRVIKKIIKGAIDGFGNNTYGWYKDFIISGGSDGKLIIYNKKGKKIANLIGHTGEIFSIALDGDRLVSGGSGQVIKVWNLSILKHKNNFKALYSYLAKKGDYIKPNLQIIRPIINLFITEDNEYIAYTNKGFFTASKEGAKYIGRHINRGANKEAKYINIDKFYDHFFRLDLVRLKLQ